MGGGGGGGGRGSQISSLQDWFNCTHIFNTEHLFLQLCHQKTNLYFTFCYILYFKQITGKKKYIKLKACHMSVKIIKCIKLLDKYQDVQISEMKSGALIIKNEALIQCP